MSRGYCEVQIPLIFEAQTHAAFSFPYLAFQSGVTVLMGSAELKAEQLWGRFVPLPIDSLRKPGTDDYAYLSLLTCIQIAAWLSL